MTEKWPLVQYLALENYFFAKIRICLEYSRDDAYLAFYAAIEAKRYPLPRSLVDP
jgi:hypothetical protein